MFLGTQSLIKGKRLWVKRQMCGFWSLLSAGYYVSLTKTQLRVHFPNFISKTRVLKFINLKIFQLLSFHIREQKLTEYSDHEILVYHLKKEKETCIQISIHFHKYSLGTCFQGIIMSKYCWRHRMKKSPNLVQ